MDTETNLEAEAPEVEVELETESQLEEDAATETDEDGNPVEEPDEPEADSDLAEVEIDGKPYKVPTELKDKFLMQADYTRKTQELAEQRKAVEATLQQLGTVSQAEQQAMVQVGMLDAQIADFETIDWQAWDQSDPQAAQNARLQLLMLNEQRRNAVAQHSQAQHQRTLLQQQETAKLIEQGQAVLREKIPDWGQDKAVALRDHAINDYGFTAEDLNSVVDPRMLMVLHDAYQFRQSQKKQAVAKKIETAQAIKPVPTLKGNSGRVAPRADTSDFLEFEKLAEKKIKRR